MVHGGTQAQHTHTHSRTHTLTHSRTHTLTHTNTHTHKHKHKHTHKHTHTHTPRTGCCDMQLCTRGGSRASHAGFLIHHLLSPCMHKDSVRTTRDVCALKGQCAHHKGRVRTTRDSVRTTGDVVKMNRLLHMSQQQPVRHRMDCFIFTSIKHVEVQLFSAPFHLEWNGRFCLHIHKNTWRYSSFPVPFIKNGMVDQDLCRF